MLGKLNLCNIKNNVCGYQDIKKYIIIIKLNNESPKNGQKNGATSQDRTEDLILTMDALYLLS